MVGFAAVLGQRWLGIGFNNADLGLFVFQYGLDLLDLRTWRRRGDPDLWTEAGRATRANEEACRAAADTGSPLTATTGACRPAMDLPETSGTHRMPTAAYARSGPIDGTAHLTATLASVAHCPDGVLRKPALGPAGDARWSCRPLRLQQRQPRPRLGRHVTWSASTPAPPCWRWTTILWRTACVRCFMSCHAFGGRWSGLDSTV